MEKKEGGTLSVGRQALGTWTATAMMVAGLAAAGLGAARPAAAHELGPFQAYGTFHDGGAFDFDIKVDEEHLQTAQMGGPARRTRYGPIAGLDGAMEARFGRFLCDLADSLTLRFDGSPAALTLSIDPEAVTAAAGGVPARTTLRVTGWIPGGARSFTFESSLPVKSFPLVLNCEGDESSTWQWLSGGTASPPFHLAARVVPPPRLSVLRRGLAQGFGAVLPAGPAVVLLMAVLFLLVRRLGAALGLVALFAAGDAWGLTLALHGASPVRAAWIDPLLALAAACLAAVALVLPVAGGHGEDRPAAVSPPRQRRFAAIAGGPALWLAPVLVALGLLHGLGSAAPLAGLLGPPGAAGTSGAVGAVAAAGKALLPAPVLPAAVLGFSLGGFGAELAILAAAFLLVGLPFRDRAWYRGRVVVPAGSLLTLVGLYWSLAGLLT